MKYPILMRTAAVAAALVAGGVFAQSAPSKSDTVVPSPVVSDVGPPPAHERNSLGAIVLENSPVRAQRDRDFESSRATAKPVGKKAKRVTNKAKIRDDLVDAREDEAVDFYRRGAGAMTPK